MILRRLLFAVPLLTAAAIPLAHAQSTPTATTTCVGTPTQGNTCTDTATNLQIVPLGPAAQSQIINGGTNLQIGASNLIDGTNAPAGAGNNIQIGEYSTIQADTTTGSSASINNSIGQSVNITGWGNNVMGANVTVHGSENTVLGNSAGSQANNGTVVGALASLGPDATNSVILGFQGYTDRANTLAVNGLTISQVAPGVMMDDAANMSQLNQGLSYLGGGAGFNNGTFTAPTYTFGTNSFDNVGGALTYLYNLRSTGTGTGGTTTTVQGGQNVTVTQTGNTATVSTTPNPTFNSVTTTDGQGNTTETSGNGVQITPASGNVVTLSGVGLDNGSNVINGVGDGQVAAGSQQAVNGGQLYQAEQQQRTYTDQQVQNGVRTAENWAKAYTDQQIAQLNDRIQRVAATGQASASMTGNFRDLPNSVAVGLGWAGGHNALAVGYRHLTENGHLSWSIQGAISGNERTIGVGLGYGW